MSGLMPTPEEAIALRRNEIHLGLPINTAFGGFVAIEHISRSRYQAMQNTNSLYAILSRRRALDLQLSHDPSRDVILKLPKDYRFELVKALADPAMDLDYPGKGPLAQGDLDANICADILNFCKQSKALPAAIFSFEGFEGAQVIDLATWENAKTQKPEIERVSSARVPLELAEKTQIHIFRDRIQDSEHYAIIVGDGLQKDPLVRIHSACFTGDCLGSRKCDCGVQLDMALEEMNMQGGVLVYLNQEGRGIGLANKIRAYHLQDQGFDTVEANLKLGFDDDERDFQVGVEILKALKIEKLRLMTNNPRKVDWLKEAGIEVTERVPIKSIPLRENQHYLATKAKKSGHML